MYTWPLLFNGYTSGRACAYTPLPRAWSCMFAASVLGYSDPVGLTGSCWVLIRLLTLTLAASDHVRGSSWSTSLTCRINTVNVCIKCSPRCWSLPGCWLYSRFNVYPETPSGQTPAVDIGLNGKNTFRYALFVLLKHDYHPDTSHRRVRYLLLPVFILIFATCLNLLVVKCVFTKGSEKYWTLSLRRCGECRHEGLSLFKQPPVQHLSTRAGP